MTRLREAGEGSAGCSEVSEGLWIDGLQEAWERPELVPCAEEEMEGRANSSLQLRGSCKDHQTQTFSVTPDGKARHSSHKLQFKMLRLSMKTNAWIWKGITALQHIS